MDGQDGGPPEVGELTGWLSELRRGNPRAVDEVVPRLYGELRRLARARLRGEGRRHTLSTTALVHEAYLKLQRHERIAAADRTSFMAVAGTTMRRILVDHARTRKRIKRGGDATPVSLDAAPEAVAGPPLLTDPEVEEVLALDQALDRLAAFDARAAEIVQLRFFAGLTLDEAAQHLDVSKKTVQRKWTAARAWLRKEMVRHDLPTVDLDAGLVD